ncbi:cupredoxin domain-containing protein [Cochlodiniinecator piscidefendens]|uniref:hypothetical protein n=1 Tax=Cochlodiniinecator piscidefendens TaxID=2715756 RepID=UPI00140AAE7C|nr:hypothetical protein [Cochlodiniinecator piscidefendens]
MSKKVLMIALALGLSPQIAAADEGDAVVEHEVNIVGNDFMPPLVYSEPGDALRFVNDDAVSRTVSASDNTWSTGPIGPGDTVILPITEGMTMSYILPYSEDDAVIFDENAPIQMEEVDIDGLVTFEEIPNE